MGQPSWGSDLSSARDEDGRAHVSAVPDGLGAGPRPEPAAAQEAGPLQLLLEAQGRGAGGVSQGADVAAREA